MTDNKGFDEILAEFQKSGGRLKSAESVAFLPGTEAISSRGGYYSSSTLLEAFFDITYNLAAYEGHRWTYSVVKPDLSFDNSRDRYQYCLSLAEEFEKSHNGPFGQGYYPTPGKLKELYDTAGGNPTKFVVPDEFDDDYILAIDAFCDRKFKERTNG